MASVTSSNPNQIEQMQTVRSTESGQPAKTSAEFFTPYSSASSGYLGHKIPQDSCVVKGTKDLSQDAQYIVHIYIVAIVQKRNKV